MCSSQAGLLPDWGKGNHLQLGGKPGHCWMWKRWVFPEMERSLLPAPLWSSSFVELGGFASEVDLAAGGGHSGDWFWVWILWLHLELFTLWHWTEWRPEVVLGESGVFGNQRLVFLRECQWLCFSCLEQSSKMPFPQRKEQITLIFFHFICEELPENGVVNVSSV